MSLPTIRKTLLDILYKLKPGLWYSISDMVNYLKNNHKNLFIDRKKRDRNTKENIYSSFYEYPVNRNNLREQTEIYERDKDVFERV